MKAQSSLIGTDGAAHLDAKAAVDLNVSFVIRPGHAEQDDPLRLHKALQNPLFLIFRMGFQNRGDGSQNLLRCILKFLFLRVFDSDLFQHFLHIRFHVCHFCSLLYLLRGTPRCVLQRA